MERWVIRVALLGALVSCLAGCRTEVREKSTLAGNVELRVLDERKPEPAFAKTTVNCKSGKSFVISTGNASGACTVNERDGEVTGGTCTDGANEASANCTSNGGQGACGNTQGSGDCTVAK